jgi:hypothetical protein
MRKILVCCSAIGVLAVASPAAYAGGHEHGHGKDHSQNHTCQGGHNCNTDIRPGDQLPRPRPTPPPAPSSSSTSSSTSSSSSSSESTSTSTVVVNNTTNVTNVISAPAAPVACQCPAPPAPKAQHRCRSIHVTRYRKVWHRGRDCCGRTVRWYTYKKVHAKRRVCV